MNTQETSEIRELSMEEVDAVGGGDIFEDFEATVGRLANKMATAVLEAARPIGPEILAYVRSGA